MFLKSCHLIFATLLVVLVLNLRISLTASESTDVTRDDYQAPLFIYRKNCEHFRWVRHKNKCLNARKMELSKVRNYNNS